MNIREITYLTTTYNRAKTLPKLYNSLKQQSVKNFTWLIIDDGSNDETSSLVQHWIKEKPFPIQYKKIKNSGKHRAINFAIPLLQSTLFMIVDSDDWLTIDCSETIDYYWQKYNHLKHVGQLTFERGINRKSPMVKISEEVVAPRYDYIEKNRKYGDYSDVFYVDRIKSFRFPEFQGEKFLTELPLYFNFSANNDTVFIDKIITIGAYRKDGLTFHKRELQVINYKGALYELNLQITKRTPLLGRIKHAVLYDYIAILSKAHLGKALYNSKNIYLCCLVMPISLVIIAMKKVGNILTD